MCSIPSRADFSDMTTVKIDTIIICIKHSKDYLCKKKASVRDVENNDIDIWSYTSADQKKKKMQDWIKEKIENRSNYSKSLIHRTILDIKNFCDRFSHYLFEAIGIKQDGTDSVLTTQKLH